jgi:hypothetical protein
MVSDMRVSSSGPGRLLSPSLPVLDSGIRATSTGQPLLATGADLSLTDSILRFKVRRGAGPTAAGPFDDR